MAGLTVDASFTKRLPKLELHAHLSGSISVQTLHNIWLGRANEEGFSLEDPLTALPPEKVHNVFTFFPLFDNYIYSLVNTLASIQRATTQVLHDFEADGVAYLELRTTPREIESQGISRDLYVSTVLECIRAFNSQSERMSTRLILSIDRRNTPEQALQTVDLAIKHRALGVVGIDLCGNPLKGDVSTLSEAFTRAKAHGLGITLHFAEVPQSSTAEELTTLLSYQPDRLGHVINVPDEIKQEIVRRKLGLELCLSCNVLAGLSAGGFGEHHFGWWRDKGCPIALCTDDVGVFRSSVSNEYLLAAQHFGLERKDLVQLNERAVESMFGGDGDKERMMRLLMEFRTSLEA